MRERVAEALREVWGFEALRPLQSAAIDAALDGRDSLVVMPTGGGKSLCYQLPPLVAGGMGVVVSPLIALMQDQVDGLALNGYPAGALHGGLSDEKRAAARARAEAGELRLLFVAPERLLSSGFLAWLKRVGVASFAIDEAHCISQWGHDFRPEYRRLAELRGVFPRAPLHAYTATATPRVREDIVRQLGLRDAVVLVGDFDRPNLTYRILPKGRVTDQVEGVLRPHEGRGGSIVYCISRKETEKLAEALSARGLRAAAYHAGLSPGVRERVQRHFKQEKLGVVVATVAFGMGIDRADVRCVVHAAMPRTLEAYQQETGRAGRDGQAAECVMLYSAGDVIRWEELLETSNAELGAGPEVLEAQKRLLREMQRYACGARCRHRALVEHFGQEYPREGCGACDVCLGELEELPRATVVAQKILSCVARVGQNMGAAHVADVLLGRATARVVERGHEKLSTFRLLADMPRDSVLACADQLVDLGVLVRAGGPYPVLSLNEASMEVMKGKREVRLYESRRGETQPRVAARSGGRGAEDALTPEEEKLFEGLRALRREIAEELGVPAFVVFADTTLRELARHRPGTREAMRAIKGIGSTKLARFGDQFLQAIREAGR
jgi:ATP-dependent DNA helicase RecQ